MSGLLITALHAEKIAIVDAKASDTHKKYHANNVFDGVISDDSRWLGKKNSKGELWLALKLEKKGKVAGVHLHSGYGEEGALEDFYFEFKDESGKWQRISDGVALGKGNKYTALDFRFDTVDVRTDTLRLVVEKSEQDFARVKEVIVWRDEVPKLERKSSGGEAIDRNTHQIAVNQVGYVPSMSKRFTAPLTDDGVVFTIRHSDDAKELFRGEINNKIGDFTEFRPEDSEKHYVIEVKGGDLKANTSDPFLIRENLYDEQFWQPAVDFFIDSRAAIGTHNSAFGGCPWRDGTYYDAIIPSLVLFYLADKQRIDGMPRQMDWKADKAAAEAPGFKLVKAPHSDKGIKNTRGYFKLDPPKENAPDVVKLIHWGAGYYLVNPVTADPSGDPEKWKIHPQTVEQVSYVVWAWPHLKQWLPQSFYEQCLEFCLENWKPSLEVSKWWHPNTYTDIYEDYKKSTWGGMMHPYKGRHAPGHSIVPNLLMYEVAKRDGLGIPQQYMNAAIKQTEFIIETLDWNEPRTTKGHRMSEHRTIPNLVWFLQHYPEKAPMGLKKKITDWAKVAVSRSDNMWDFRRFDLENEWTIPKLNDVGNTLGLPAITLAASWVVDDAELKKRLRVLALSAVDHVYGRNPRLAAAPDLEEKGFPEVERGWPKSHKMNACARLELCRGSISSLPGTEMYPFNPEGKFRHPEGWVNYGATWCISLSYFKFDRNGKTTPRQ